MFDAAEFGTITDICCQPQFAALIICIPPITYYCSTTSTFTVHYEETHWLYKENNNPATAAIDPTIQEPTILGAAPWNCSGTAEAVAVFPGRPVAKVVATEKLPVGVAEGPGTRAIPEAPVVKAT